MITCPLCKELVWDLEYKQNIDDEDKQDFHCGTPVHLGNERYSSHYYRITVQECFPEYTLHIPPFHLSWLEGKNELRIYNSIHKAETTSAWKFVPKVDFQEVIHWIERLKTLRPFA